MIMKKAVMSALAAAFLAVIVAPAVSALPTYYLPEKSGQNKNVFLAIGRLGKDAKGDRNTLPVPQTSVKLVYNRVPDSVFIFDGPFCEGSTNDNHAGNIACPGTGVNDVNYSFQAINNDTGATLGQPIVVKGSDMKVNGQPMVNNSYSVSLAGLQGAAPSSGGKYFVRMTAAWAVQNNPSCTPDDGPPCYSGTNTFMVIMPDSANDIVTYPETDYDAAQSTTTKPAIAVLPAKNSQYADITFEFAPKCNLTGPSLTQNLSWDDADYTDGKSGNQIGTLYWDLYDDTLGGPAVDHMENKQLGGQNEHKDRTFNFIAQHKYRWVWSHVDDNNGLNVYLPFDGYDYTVPCANTTPPPTPPPPSPPPAVSSPYFKVTGGDVSVGQGMSLSGSDCGATGVDVDNEASIVGWNRGSANGYGGANTQYGAFALNHLQEFSTAQNGAIRPSGLAFANTLSTPGVRVEPGNGLYGGGFGGGSCINNYFSDATNIQTGDTLLTNLPGFPGGGNVPNGASLTYYINGDLYINSNVRFSGSYPTTADIPHFKVVVHGNIYIDHNVSQIDGIYVAEPTGPTADDGNIYTCATNNAFVPLSLDSQLSANCGTTLTINGAIVSRQLWLMRTGGDVTSTPAETVNYLPELWVGTKPATTGDSGKYDAITGLPPVL